MWLVLGDGMSFLLITLVGFANHESLSAASLGRMLATFLPFYAAWLMAIPWLGLLSATGLPWVDILWRVLLGVLFAAPLGGFLRGLLLDAPILPVFVIVMGGVTAVTMLAWRLLASRLLGESPPV
jgi:hypothetical protein